MAGFMVCLLVCLLLRQGLLYPTVASDMPCSLKSLIPCLDLLSTGIVGVHLCLVCSVLGIKPSTSRMPATLVRGVQAGATVRHCIVFGACKFLSSNSQAWHWPGLCLAQGWTQLTAEPSCPPSPFPFCEPGSLSGLIQIWLPLWMYKLCALGYKLTTSA